MTVPEHLWRFPTAAAITSLIQRFDFHYDESMQDWEWMVSDSDRIGEFVDACTSGDLTDDERFTLMQTILQSCEDRMEPLEEQQRWSDVIQLLRDNVELHAHTIYYWSCMDTENDDEVWRVTPFVRQIVRDLPRAFEPADDKNRGGS